MKNILKSISLMEVGGFENFLPEIGNDFYVLAFLTIGEEGKECGCEYSIGICTPQWLEQNIRAAGPSSGRHLLVVNRFDPIEIRTAIDEILSQCEREDPEETSAMIARFFAWGYEVHHP